jgi:hypothetical protein
MSVGKCPRLGRHVGQKTFGKKAKEEQRPADLKSATQIAVQNAVQTVLRDTLEPPKTTLNPPYSTTTYARLSALRIGCSTN